MIGNNGLFALIKNVIGTVRDLLNIPYSPHNNENTLMAYTRTAYYHVHGASFLYPDKSNPITLNSGVASWSETGSIVEIIPANTIIKDFDLHWCSLGDISATLYGVVDIFSGASGEEVKIGSVDVVRTANFSRENAVPVQVPQQSANARISARFSDSTTSSRSVDVKFYGHVYGTSLT